LVLVSRVAAAADTECATWLSEELEEDAIEALGREYLAGRATVPGLDRIASLIESADADVALDKLQKLMQDDYANDRIVNLSGWFVSVTEAQVFAVLAKCAA
jgi:hypothetical protein